MRTSGFDSETSTPEHREEGDPGRSRPPKQPEAVVHLCKSSPESPGPANWRDEELDELQQTIDQLQKKLESLSALVTTLKATRDAKRRLRCLK